MLLNLKNTKGSENGEKEKKAAKPNCLSQNPYTDSSCTILPIP